MVVRVTKPLVVLLSAITACAGARSAETSQPATEAATAETVARTQPEWWCVSFNNEMNGLCLAGRPACEAMMGELRRSSTDPNEKIGDCTRQANPVCLDKTAGGRTELVCHPSFSTCRSHADHMKNAGDTVTECRSTDPKAASAKPADNPSWWCVAYEPASVGSCERSLAQCEGSRDFLRSKLPGETIECVAQQSATCFELEDAPGKRRSLCHPTAAICKATLANARKDKKMNPVGDCQSAE
ncbi:MAG: hypothetical protein H6Q90_3030 [Deltaproteobacteria bacterium]|nr:hypothetical protein [Deltaproteobacteria bacterium]